MLRRKKSDQTKLNSINKPNNSPAITYITESATIKGDMSCKDDIRIAGTIEGEVTSDKKVIVAETGLIKGTLSSPAADISGKVKGDVNASKSLILRSTAKIEGEISTDKIKIEEGAQVEGKFMVGAGNNTSVNEASKKAGSKFSMKK